MLYVLVRMLILVQYVCLYNMLRTVEQLIKSHFVYSKPHIAYYYTFNVNSAYITCFFSVDFLLMSLHFQYHVAMYVLMCVRMYFSLCRLPQRFSRLTLHLIYPY